MKRANLEFKNEEHRRIFNELIKRDSVNEGDIFREVFFYIMSCELCYRFVDKINDFNKRQLMLDGYPDFASSSERELIKLAMYIFTGGSTEIDSLNQIFYPLSTENTNLVINTLRYYNL